MNWRGRRVTVAIDGLPAEQRARLRREVLASDEEHEDLDSLRARIEPVVERGIPGQRAVVTQHDDGAITIEAEDSGLFG